MDRLLMSSVIKASFRPLGETARNSEKICFSGGRIWKRTGSVEGGAAVKWTQANAAVVRAKTAAMAQGSRAGRLADAGGSDKLADARGSMSALTSSRADFRSRAD